ncbi:Hypothetical protein, putative [Bodo saltans]|uniref:Uncharacterized protein n=1 Tax=Bodo saltans TaxID=75058 RepID=A0A0S4JKV0_BODSA|nr:Hypothetical protein, putative [Bodo saltans]|eukprot:CUG89084.1 Hypothetical protein, putative [Bodo saltans]
MKIRIVGGPAEGKVEVECDAATNFAAIMVLAENAIGKGILHDKFHFFRGEIVDKKAKAIALVAPTDTPQTAGLPAHGALLVLKAKDGSPQNTPRNDGAAAAAAGKPKTPRALTFRDRMIAMYEAYEPSKAGTVDSTLEKYRGKEEAVIKKLVEKYGPEPPQSVAPDAPPVAAVTPVASRGDKKAKSAKERIVAIYQKYDPAKVSTVDATLEKFKGKEEAVIKKLVEKYGPEPSDELTQVAPVVSPTTTSPTPEPTATPATPPEPPVTPASAEPTPASPAPPPSFRDRMIIMYELYEPGKVNTVDATLSKYKGKEEAVIKKLVEKYGPEPKGENSPVEPTPAPPQTTVLDSSPNDKPRERSQTIVRSNPTPVAAEPAEETVNAPAPSTAPTEIQQKNGRSASQAPSHSEGDSTSQSPKSLEIAQGAHEHPTSGDRPRDVSSPASEMHSTSMPATDPRFQALMANILGRVLDEANHHTLRKRFLIWMRHANEQKAEKLVAQGRWTRGTDGAYEFVESSPPFKTPDLVAFLEENKGTSRYQVLSDALSDALRVAMRKSNSIISPEAMPIIPVTFKDDDATAAQMTQCIHALDIGKECQDQLHALQLKYSLVVQEQEALRAAHSVALTRLATTEPAVDRAAELKRQLELVTSELDNSKKLSSKQEVEIKLLTTDLTKTNRDLDMERRGLPTNMEVIVRQKDQRLASLEQEISKLRLKVKQQQSSTAQQAQRIQELESDVELLERSRSVVPFTRRTAAAAATATSPATARQWQPGGSPDLSQPKMFIQSLRSSPRGFDWVSQGTNHAATTPGRSPSRPVPPIAISLIGLKSADSGTEVSVSHEPSARLSRAETTPPASSPRTAREIRDLVIRSEILEQELTRPPTIEYAGHCPHCTTSLTALKGGDGVAHRAFCFSCRRSFTFDELSEYAKPKSRSRMR